VPEDHTAERPRKEPEGIRRERGHRAGDRIEIWKENPVDHERRCRAVEEKTYHSIAVPMKLAMTTRRMELGTDGSDMGQCGMRQDASARCNATSKRVQGAALEQFWKWMAVV
jgi:hypothetical protein